MHFRCCYTYLYLNNKFPSKTAFQDRQNPFAENMTHKDIASYLFNFSLVQNMPHPVCIIVIYTCWLYTVLETATSIMLFLRICDAVDLWVDELKQ